MPGEAMLPPRPRRERTVVSFRSTFDAMEAGRLCGEAGVPGRIIPLPVEITAECGLAWAMPEGAGPREAFMAAVEGSLVPEGIYTLAL